MVDWTFRLSANEGALYRSSGYPTPSELLEAPRRIRVYSDHSGGTPHDTLRHFPYLAPHQPRTALANPSLALPAVK